MREPSAAPGLPAVGTWAEQVRWIDRVFKRLGHGPNRPHSTDLAYARDILRGARDHAAEQATLAGVSDPAAVRALVAAARALVTNRTVIGWDGLPIADEVPSEEYGPLHDAFRALTAALAAFPDGAPEGSAR